MSEMNNKTNRRINWKLVLIIWCISVLAWILVLPFTVVMLGDSINQTGSLGSFIFYTFISNLIILGIASLVGTITSRRTGLSSPLIESWLEKTPQKSRIFLTIRNALITGAAVGVLLIAIDVVIFTPYLASAMGISNANILNPDVNRAPPGYGFLAAVSAGATEEVIFRFLGLSGFAWLGGLIFRDPNGRPKNFVLWFAVLVMGIIFGLAHLQTPAMMGWEPAPAAITRALALNSIAGVVYGRMYWKKGLESAMFTHFSTDIVLHVFVPIAFLCC